LVPSALARDLSAALRNGLPVVVPDIGSFQERVKGRPMSWVQPWNSGPEEWVKFFMSLNKREKNVPLLQNTPWRNPNPYDYKENYLTGIPSLSCKDFAIDLKFIRGHLPANSHDEILLSRKERLLLFLLKVRNWPGVKNVLRFVPYGTQRKIKRFFSRKPIHDLLKK